MYILDCANDWKWAQLYNTLSIHFLFFHVICLWNSECLAPTPVQMGVVIRCYNAKYRTVIYMAFSDSMTFISLKKLHSQISFCVVSDAWKLSYYLMDGEDLPIFALRIPIRQTGNQADELCLNYEFVCPQIVKPFFWSANWTSNAPIRGMS